MLLKVRKRRFKTVLRNVFLKNEIHFDGIYTTDTTNIQTDKEIFENADRTPAHFPVREKKREEDEKN